MILEIKITIGVFLTNFIVGGIEKSYSLLFNEILLYFKTSFKTVSFVFGLNSALKLLLGPLCVMLIMKLNCRKTAIIGSFISFLGLFICSFTDNLIIFIIGYSAINGFGLCLIFIPSMVILVRHCTKNLAVKCGITSSGIALGSCTFPYIVQYLTDVYGLSNCLFLLSALLLNGIVFASLYNEKLYRHKLHSKDFLYDINFEYLQNSFVTNHIKCSPLLSPVSNTQYNRKYHFSPNTIKSYSSCGNSFIIDYEGSYVKVPNDGVDNYYKSIKNNILYAFSNKLISIFLFSQITMAIGNGFWTTYIVDFSRVIGLSEHKAAFLLALEGVSQLSSKLISGFIFNKSNLKNKRIMLFSFAVALTALSSLCMNLLNLFETTYSSFIILMTLSFFRGSGSGVVFSQTNVVISDICNLDNLSNIIGYLSLAKGVGFIISSISNGAILDKFGSYLLVYTYMGGIQLFSSCFLFYVAISSFSKEDLNKSFYK